MIYKQSHIYGNVVHVVYVTVMQNVSGLKQDCVFLGSHLRDCLSADFLNYLLAGLANCSY